LAPAPQSWPAIVQPGVPGTVRPAQVPRTAPAAFLQVFVQHSKSDAQTSLICVQYDGWLLQTPLLQNFEQQSPF
jgi:hypothetical protein